MRNIANQGKDNIYTEQDKLKSLKYILATTLNLNSNAGQKFTLLTDLSQPLLKRVFAGRTDA